MTTMLFEPASAVAAGHCLTARLVDKDATTNAHPRRCGWCDFPLDALRQLIDGFNEWAGFDPKTGKYAQHDARAFQGLPQREQARLVLEAQSFDAESSPAEPAIEPEEDDAWLA